MLNRQRTDTLPALLGDKDTVLLSGNWNRIPIRCTYWQRRRPVTVVRVQSSDMKVSDFYITDLSEHTMNGHETVVSVLQ